ncbi:glutathione S-transferase-like protein [Hapsidospora chrysogenum ATCC 11550]|uniref:Glutathione S-transferase-like protein n=1 Tax=Hapsidospora chrysogenum (strain ATCC 11550 / CBS 779.69 / DSM 880 / IAM 14645 / JCM 23072 / IMI 49137) TaxID=857340 RepID=A0A086SVB1_HAPC1|nr:glutathione S-transferase-like protein [Hapsidospora chrysogenum ATCC 11550]
MSDYNLYAYWRSSCSARLRIALNIKGISYDNITVNLLKDEQLSAEHRALNPSCSVPLLVRKKPVDATTTTTTTPFKIGQSVAALEYLDEVHPEAPLLPPSSDPEARAVVRTLVNIVACDIQPVTNLRIMRRVRSLGGNAEEWNRELIVDGLRAYEDVIAGGCAGRYSYGDDVTMADVCLLPGVWNAKRFGVEVAGQFPTIAKVTENLEQLRAVQDAFYVNQPDAPEEMRAK